jgi:twitching motility protein PilI
MSYWGAFAPSWAPKRMTGGIGSSDGGRLFGILAGLDDRYRAIATRLPDAAPPVEVWAGVLFRVREQRFLAPLDEIAEVLEIPADLTPVRGAKPWALGVANNRGTLLPIFDLGALTLGAKPSRRDSDRVLVVRQDELPCGLAVTEAVGIRHFEVTSGIPEAPTGLGLLAPFAASAFPLGGKPVPVLSLKRVIADPMLGHGAA